MSRLCLSACHLLFFSLSLTYAYVPIAQACEQRVIASFKKNLRVQRRAYQRNLQREFSSSPTYLGPQICRLKVSLGRLHLGRPAVPESDGYLRGNSLLDRECCSTVKAFLPSHRFALTVHESSLRDAKTDDIAFCRHCRRFGFACSRIPLKASVFDGVSCDNYTTLRSVSRRQRAAKRGFRLRAERLSSSLKLTDPHSDLVSGGRYPLPSPCGCAVTFVVGRNAQQDFTAQEEKHCAPQAFSALVYPVSTCNAEFTPDYWSECAAEGLPVRRESSAHTSVDSFAHGVAGNVFPNCAERSTATYLRGGEVVPGTAHSRLDVFLTKCTGVSRTSAAVYLIKGRNVWVNESLCMTPSRRLHPGDCVTCLITCSCKGETAEETENAKPTNGTDIEGKRAVRSRFLGSQNGRQHAVQHEILTNICRTAVKAGSTQPNSSLTILTEVGKAIDFDRFLLCSGEKAQIKDGGNDSTKKDATRFADERTLLIPGAQMQSGQLDTASKNEELHKTPLGPSTYCSVARSNTDVNKGNTQREAHGLPRLEPVRLIPDERPLQILYEDDYILVLNKPANVLTHPPELNIRNIGRYNAAGSVVQRLFHYFQSNKRSVPETLSTLMRSSVSASVLPKHLKTQLRTNTKSDVERTCGEKAYTVKELEDHTEKALDRPTFFEKLSRIPLSVSRPGGVVHRLDYGTTGVLLVAKTFAAATALRAQWKRREVFKGYVGVCRPELKARQKIDAPIKRHHVHRWRMHALDNPSASIPPQLDWSARSRVVSNLYDWAHVGETTETEKSASTAKVKKASTIFLPAGGNSAWGLIAAVALTGRTHQVRVHLEYAGHPLVGDTVYGQMPKKAKKKRVTEGKQHSVTCRHCARQAKTERSMTLANISHKEAHSLAEIPKRSCSFSGRARAVIESDHGGGLDAEFENCISNFQGETSSTNRPLLHAYLLRIRHPITGCYHEFKAPVPPDIERIAEYLNPDWRRRLDKIFNDEVPRT